MRSRELPYGWVVAMLAVVITMSLVVGQPWLAWLAPALLIIVYLLQKPEYLLYALFLSIPISAEVQVTPTLGTDLPDEMLMWMVTVMMLFLVYRERKRVAGMVSHPVAALILLSWLWCWVSMANAADHWLSLKFILAKTWYLVPFLFGTILLLHDAARLKKVMVLLVAPMLILTAVTLVRHGIKGFDFAEVSNVVWPYFRNHVNYGALLVCMVPVILWLRKQTGTLVWLPALVLVLAGLYFSYSRGAWLALLVGIITPWLLRKNILRAAALVVFLTLALFATWLIRDNNYLRFRPDFESTIYHADLGAHMEATYRMKDLSTAERFYRWIAAVRTWEEHPLTGVGPNHFVPTYRSYTVEAFRTYVSDNPERSTVHNYFLLLLAEQGMPGLLLFILTLWAMVVTAQRVYNRYDDDRTRGIVSCVVSILSMIIVLVSLSDLVETDKIGPIFYTCAGVLVLASSGAYIQRVPEPVAEEVK